MNLYRCTRRRPYRAGTPYYIPANSESEALAKMQDRFPQDVLDSEGFDIQLWERDIPEKRGAAPRPYLLDWLRAEQSINNEGEPDSIQRLVYYAARATTPADWAEVYRLANVVHGQCMDDTGLGLLLNALCATAAKAYRGSV